jgi:hypothetical protein
MVRGQSGCPRPKPRTARSTTLGDSSPHLKAPSWASGVRFTLLGSFRNVANRYTLSSEVTSQYKHFHRSFLFHKIALSFQSPSFISSSTFHTSALPHFLELVGLQVLRLSVQPPHVNFALVNPNLEQVPDLFLQSL